MEIKVLQQYFFDSSFDFPAPFFTGLTFPECFVSFDAHCLLYCYFSHNPPPFNDKNTFKSLTGIEKFLLSSQVTFPFLWQDFTDVTLDDNPTVMLTYRPK
jgi:hypothetical protein